MVREAVGDWRLFNLAGDPGEHNDVSASFPELRAELERAYEAQGAKVNYLRRTQP